MDNFCWCGDYFSEGREGDTPYCLQLQAGVGGGRWFIFLGKQLGTLRARGGVQAWWGGWGCTPWRAWDGRRGWEFRFRVGKKKVEGDG